MRIEPSLPSYYSQGMSLIDEAQKILVSISPEWVSVLVDLIQSIQSYVKRDAPEGLCEFLEYEFKLEVLDTGGRSARLTKRERVKFLQDNVIAFEDFAWGDGDVLAEYTCSPGFVVDCYREGERWNILISLRESKHRGDIQDFYIQSKLKNALTGKEEWCQVETSRTRSVKLFVIFPKQRHCTQAVVVERIRDRTTHLNSQNFTLLPDGRQQLSWENIEPQRSETYTIKWSW